MTISSEDLNNDMKSHRLGTPEEGLADLWMAA